MSHPWAIDFLPDGRHDRHRTRRQDADCHQDGGLGEPIKGVPDVDVGGQGGLLDVALHPDFAGNRLVYWSFSEAGQGGNSTAVARGR